MTARKKRPKNGDVFSIKLNERMYGYGQLVEGSNLGCYVFYDLIAEEHPILLQVVNTPILFITFTVDQKIVSGEWEVIGNAPIPAINIPEFKTKYMENNTIMWMVMKYDGTIVRKANDIEKRSLNNFKSYNPNILENVIKAKFGITPWDNYYSELLNKK